MKKCCYAKLALCITIAGILVGFCGCSSSSVAVEKPAAELRVVHGGSEVPGIVEYIWEEPMVDVVDVPPGLDPEGHYYRPAHQEVIEVRQGRWKYYRHRD